MLVSCALVGRAHWRHVSHKRLHAGFPDVLAGCACRLLCPAVLQAWHLCRLSYMDSTFQAEPGQLCRFSYAQLPECRIVAHVKHVVAAHMLAIS